MPTGIYKRSDKELERLSKMGNRFLGGNKITLGYKHSEENKQRISLALKEQWLYGIRKGKPILEEHKRKLSEANKGKKSYRWKGGITPIIIKIRNCFEYKQWRLNVMHRDKFSCFICKKIGGKLEVDHYPIKFREIFNSKKIMTFEEAIKCNKFWDINNGRTLCKECHRKLPK